MITGSEYLQLVSEAYDLSDYPTKKAVLFCNEAQKDANIEHIVNNLYQHIKNDCTAIDFGTIPKSKGIISKIDNFDNIIDCITTIKDLVMSYQESTKPVDELSTCISNIQKRERIFGKAFTLNIDFPMMIYNTAVLSVVSATSLLITSCINYVKNGHDSFVASLDKASYVKSKDHVLYQYIQQFNKTCANGSLDKVMDSCIKNNITSANEATMEIVDEDFAGTIKDIGGALTSGGLSAGAAMAAKALAATTVGKVAAIIVAAGFAMIFLIKMLRIAIKWFARMRMNISDWFALQAHYLQINAENLKYRDDDKGDDHKKKVYEKQTKWVETFKRLSNAFALKDMKAQKEAKQNDDRQKYPDEKNDDSGNNDGGLF